MKIIYFLDEILDENNLFFPARESKSLFYSHDVNLFAAPVFLSWVKSGS